MGILVWIMGILGGLCAVMGIIVATEAVTLTVGAAAVVDWMFWFGLAVVLLLGCIAAAVSRTQLE